VILTVLLVKLTEGFDRAQLTGSKFARPRDYLDPDVST
jgi:hypothetical protein